jgi:hypothetical protein
MPLRATDLIGGTGLYPSASQQEKQNSLRQTEVNQSRKQHGQKRKKKKPNSARPVLLGKDKSSSGNMASFPKATKAVHTRHAPHIPESISLYGCSILQD